MSATRKIRRSNASKKTVVHESSGNGFEDLVRPDAIERLAKAQLSRVIRKRLTRFLNKLDMHVHIQVRPRSKRGTRAAITVEFLSTS